MKLKLLALISLILLVSPLMGDITHTMQNGETLYSIARKYGVVVAEIMKDNGIVDATKVRVGAKLLIKGVDEGAPEVATTEYVVQKDDTFWSLSRRFGLTLAQLQALNPGVDPARLRVGTRLKVPAAVAVNPAASTGTPATTNQSTGTQTQTQTQTQTSPVTVAPLTQLPRAAGTEAELWPLPGTRTAVRDRNFDHIRIQAAAGDPVLAVSSGKVRYVAPFQTYRYIVIIQTRASSSRVYDFWYAGVDDVYVRAGDWVNKGATIARVATNGIDGKAQVAFGVYQGTTPVDHTRLIWQ